MINFPFVRTITLCGSTGFFPTTGVGFRNPFYSHARTYCNCTKNVLHYQQFVCNQCVNFIYGRKACGEETKNGPDVTMCIKTQLLRLFCAEIEGFVAEVKQGTKRIYAYRLE